MWRTDNELLTSAVCGFVDRFSVKNPKLWWPNGYGEAHLYDLRVDAHHSTGSSSVHHKIGFRRVEFVQSDTTAGNTTGKTFYFKINGVPIFAKGGNWIPSDSFPTRVNASMTTHLLRSAHAANMNMVSVITTHGVWVVICPLTRVLL